MVHDHIPIISQRHKQPRISCTPCHVVDSLSHFHLGHPYIGSVSSVCLYTEGIPICILIRVRVFIIANTRLHLIAIIPIDIIIIIIIFSHAIHIDVNAPIPFDVRSKI